MILQPPATVLGCVGWLLAVAVDQNPAGVLLWTRVFLLHICSCWDRDSVVFCLHHHWIHVCSIGHLQSKMGQQVQDSAQYQWACGQGQAPQGSSSNKTLTLIRADPLYCYLLIRQVALQVLFNHFVVGTIFSHMGYLAFQWRGQAPIETLPTFSWFLVELSVYLLAEEIGFYYFHRYVFPENLDGSTFPYSSTE